MENRILDFIRLLRDSGVRISTSESLDGYHALKLIDLFERDSFRYALRSTLIKDSIDLPKFDKLFELYFQEPVVQEDDTELSDEEFEQQLEQMEQMLQQQDFDQLGEPRRSTVGEDSPLSQDGQDYNESTRKKELYKQGSEVDMQQQAKEIANSRKFENWEIDNIEATVERVMAENGMNAARVEAKHETRKDRFQDIEQKHKQMKSFVRDEVEKTMVRQFGEEVLEDIMDTMDLMEVDLGSLTEDQLVEIQEKVKRIAKKISTRKSNSEKSGKSGKIDVRKTIRASIQHGNVASELKYKKKKNRKPKLVVFCDVSGSVYIYVSFMLQLLLALQNAFTQVESYVFVDKIKRVTHELANVENDVFELVKKYTNDSKLGFSSDFGLAFELFNKEQVFDKKTVVIVVADGVNYNMDPKAEELRGITDKSRAVYWLNPLPEDMWDSQGCAMPTYRPHCAQVSECRNLNQLEDFIKQLIKL